MPRFRVTFRKIVYGNTGHACTICQRVLDLEERDYAAVQARAIQGFCALEKTANWLDHADWMEITLADRALPSDRREAARRAA